MFLRDHIQYLGRQKRLCLFNILRDLEITQEQLLFSRLLLEIPVVFSDQRLFLRSKPKTFTTFIATSNNYDLLTDPTGSRRFICVEVKGRIDYAQPIDYDQLYAEAKELLRRGERGIATQVTARALIRQTGVHNRFLQDMLQKTLMRTFH